MYIVLQIRDVCKTLCPLKDVLVTYMSCKTGQVSSE